MRTAISVVLLALFLLVGCATNRRSKEPTREPGFFERPDVDSLH